MRSWSNTIQTISRLTKSDFREPVNIGSDEMVSMNEMAEIILSFEDRELPIHHIPGPEGVRGRNSDNTLIKEKLGWAPTMKLKVSIPVLLNLLTYYTNHAMPVKILTVRSMTRLE